MAAGHVGRPRQLVEHRDAEPAVAAGHQPDHFAELAHREGGRAGFQGVGGDRPQRVDGHHVGSAPRARW